MRTVDYLNRELTRAEKYKDPEKHLNIINELKEEFFGKEVDIINVLKQLRNHTISFNEDTPARKYVILADILIAQSQEK